MEFGLAKIKYKIVKIQLMEYKKNYTDQYKKQRGGTTSWNKKHLSNWRKSHEIKKSNEMRATLPYQ